jgi:hypothetical protein
MGTLPRKNGNFSVSQRQPHSASLEPPIFVGLVFLSEWPPGCSHGTFPMLLAKGDLAGTMVYDIVQAAWSDGWGLGDALACRLHSLGSSRSHIAEGIIEATEGDGMPSWLPQGLSNPSPTLKGARGVVGKALPRWSRPRGRHPRKVVEALKVQCPVPPAPPNPGDTAACSVCWGQSLPMQCMQHILIAAVASHLKVCECVGWCVGRRCSGRA